MVSRMTLDYSKLAKKGLLLKLQGALKYFGIPVDVYAVSPQDNAYNNPSDADADDDPIDAGHRVLNPNPDTTWATTPRISTSVLFKTSVSGLDIGSLGISTSDKIMKEYTIVSVTQLNTNEKLIAHIDATRTMELQITKPLAQNDFTQIAYAYTARVM